MHWGGVAVHLHVATGAVLSWQHLLGGECCVLKAVMELYPGVQRLAAAAMNTPARQASASVAQYHHLCHTLASPHHTHTYETDD